MEHDNSRRGRGGEQAVIAAYRTVDTRMTLEGLAAG